MLTLRKLVAGWRTTTFRVTGMIAAFFAIAAILAVGGLYWRVNAEITRQMAAEVLQEADQLVSLAKRVSSDRFGAEVAARARVDGSHLYLLQGRQRAAPRIGNLAELPMELASGDGVQVFRYRRADGAPGLAVGAGRRLANSLTLVVARDATVLQRLSGDIWWWFLVGVLVMSALGVAAGLLVSHLVLGRIGRITATSERIIAGRLTERIPLAGTGDELDGLADNLNRMLERIETLMAGFREVSDNIAHDLKTPLNRLRNRAEAALSDARGAVAHRESLEHILVEADDIIRTFNALLQVARLEVGAVDDARESFDLSQLARDIVELYEPVAEENGGTIAFDGPDVLEVVANRQLIGQALTNLIENSLKYGHSKMTCSATARVDITVAAVREAGGVALTVADRGAGIEETERAEALRRFGRLDRARSQPGTGLGLSLVAAVASVHGGSLVLSDNAPGLAATMSLPILA